MSPEFNLERRRLLSVAAAAAVELGFADAAHPGSDKFATKTSTATLAARRTSFESMKSIKAVDLEIGYAEAGASNEPVVLLLHGWPYDIYSYVDVAPLLVSVGYRVIVPYLRGHGTTRFLSKDTPRNGQQSALAVDMVAFLDALGVENAIVGGYDWGARTANIMAALWPDRCKAMVSVSGYLIGSQEMNKKPLPPKAELAWWYQFYFATERGRLGYQANTRDFVRLIWETASPTWQFDDAIFARSATAFENPDHVAITVHNYRWRLGLVDGESRFDAFEEILAKSPVITIPTITLEGDRNAAPHPEPKAYAGMFSGKYQHRNITGGIGHNLPQEAPEDFAQAIIDVDRL